MLKRFDGQWRNVAPINGRQGQHLKLFQATRNINDHFEFELNVDDLFSSPGLLLNIIH